MTNVTPERREYLTAKYPAITAARPPDPALNTVVQAMLDSERITAGAYGRDNTPLFDPAWSPEMWERANKAMHDLRTRIGLPDDDPNRIRLESHDYDLADCDGLPHDAVVVWAVGARTALVGHPDHKTQHPTKRVDYFTGMLQFFQSIDDYWCYGGEDNPRYAADYERRCNVNIAKDCTAPLSRDVNDFGGGSTRTMPVRRGQFLLLFRCCRVCERLAGRLADTNYQISVMEAHERAASAPLPKWARRAPLRLRVWAALRRWLDRP